MITLRHHLASLIAVFLALGLGVVAGSTFISPVTVKALSASINRLDARDRALEAQNNQLNQTNGQLQQALTTSRDIMVQGRLAGRPVDLISFESTPASETSDVASTIAAAGARLQSSVVLSNRLGLADDASRTQVATGLGLTDTSTGALQADVVQKLADALSGRVPGLEKWVSAGLAKTTTVPNPLPLASVATAGSVILILAPAAPQPGPAAPDLGRLLIVPLVRSLNLSSAVVAIGEDGSANLPVLAPIRADATLRVVTADGTDTPLGQAGLVLGLAQAISTGVYGNFGLGAGAGAPLPSPLPPVPSPSPSSPVSATASPR